jgi:hypothetical protein
MSSPVVRSVLKRNAMPFATTLLAGLASFVAGPKAPPVISLLFLISCPSAFAGGQHGLSIKVFTSPDDQFWTNSVIIEGTHEVMLVDAQLTKTNAERVLQEIKRG